MTKPKMKFALPLVLAVATAGCYVQTAPPPPRQAAPPPQQPHAQPQPQPDRPTVPPRQPPRPAEPGPDQPPTAPPEQPSAVPADFAITLERTPCFGKCPMYRVTVNASGQVVFEGQRFVAQPGTHRAEIGADAVAQVHAMVEQSQFFGLADCYCERRVTDLPSSVITVTMSGQTKTVRHYKGDDKVPAAYLELEREIDDASGSQRWVESAPVR